MRAPSDASRALTSAPIPLAPPETTMTLPFIDRNPEANIRRIGAHGRGDYFRSWRGLIFSFVGRWTVDGRNHFFIHAQVNRKLSSMVSHVIQYAVANSDITRL